MANQNIPLIRIFLSSPGDVTDERQIALDIMERLPNRPYFREKVAIRVIAWDKPDSGTPMRATLTPQEAINVGLPKPSECDLVFSLFWSRIGTPFSMDGQRFESGTHWELLDGLKSGRAEVIIYHRTEEPRIGLNDPQRPEKLAQYDRLQTFLKSDLFYDPSTGDILRGINNYASPDDFRAIFENALEELVLEILDKGRATGITDRSEHADGVTFKTALWQGSPFPGLRAFTEADAPIFFGRGRELDSLVKKVADSRFVGVVGASGSGKSSLVGAGLIPRLRANAIVGDNLGSKDWVMGRFTPASFNDQPMATPFDALYYALLEALPALEPNPLEAPRVRQNFVASLTETPENLKEICAGALKGQADWAELLLFVDQFEELFTLVNEEQRQQFIRLLEVMASSPKIRAVVTMRSDFYPRCIDYPELASLLEQGSFPLSIPTAGALYEMITRPAEQAALEFDNGLAQTILDDTGTDPGSLALMAYALDELYQIAEERADRRLTFADYEALGRVPGAIGKRAATIYEGLDTEAQAMLTHVFRELVAVDEQGTPTRKRMAMDLIKGVPEAERLVGALTAGRLLVQSNGEQGATVEVAHEALFRHWPKLVEWLDEYRGDLFLLSQMRRAAAEWDKRGRLREFLWLGERNLEMQAMLKRLEPELNAIEQAFARDEFEHLLEELDDDTVPHSRRAEIGDRLVVIGDRRIGVGVDDNGIPEIAWCAVDLPELRAGRAVAKIDIDEPELGKLPVTLPFAISKYPITYRQMLAFYEASDGYAQDQWWQGLAEQRKYWEQNRKIDNYPAENMNWYTAVAFTRWLSTKLGFEVHLPTEAEWWLAATLNDHQRVYPWGSEWNSNFANTKEEALGRTTAVGLFPGGVAACGTLDMSGTVWEWCLNEYASPAQVKLDSKEYKGMRGGAYNVESGFARAVSRSDFNGPNYFSDDFGFRVCGVRPPSL